MFQARALSILSAVLAFTYLAAPESASQTANFKEFVRWHPHLNSTSISAAQCLFQANEGVAIGRESGASIKACIPAENTRIIRSNAEYTNRIFRA
jgi:hypothetical protein